MTMAEKINFQTADGVKIVGNIYDAPGGAGALLLHMRPATKESWAGFALRLNGARISALAIDLRGHGESTEQDGKKINYERFAGGSHSDCRKDVDAALKWWMERGIKDIFIVGGSIGANLAIDAMARHPEIKKGIALSPGLEYLGISADDKISKLKNGQKLFLIASKDDAYSYESAVKLNKLNSKTEIKIYEDAGHGTYMFAKYPELMDDVINFLKNSDGAADRNSNF